MFYTLFTAFCLKKLQFAAYNDIVNETNSK